MKTQYLIPILSTLTMLGACDGSGPGRDVGLDQNVPTAQSRAAAVTAVNYSGESGNYIFSVTVESPDTGCNQFADWWEVLTPDGDLVYRRILAHSHVNEQPFIRSGGPVSVAADQEIIIRAHMNNIGYGTEVFRGSVEQGFTTTLVEANLASELEDAQPLPESCAF